MKQEFFGKPNLSQYRFVERMLAKMAQERGLGELTNIYAIGRQHKLKRLLLFVLAIPYLVSQNVIRNLTMSIRRFMCRFIIC